MISPVREAVLIGGEGSTDDQSTSAFLSRAAALYWSMSPPRFTLELAWITESRKRGLRSTGSPDIDLLRDVVDPLVHTELVGEIAAWHFFWEPELRLRLRWQDPSRQADLEHRLAEILNNWREEGRLGSWSKGSHGTEGERHPGEAEEYGPEVWGLIQKEWQNGSELALRLLSLNATGGLTGRLTPTLERHWNRHVHLYTNRIFGFPSNTPWAAEIVLCLIQARGYLSHAISSLAEHAGYKPLVEKYRQMEKHTSAALQAWEEPADPQTTPDAKI